MLEALLDFLGNTKVCVCVCVCVCVVWVWVGGVGGCVSVVYDHACRVNCVYSRSLYPHMQIATIGPTTSEAVQMSGLTATVCPSALQPARLVKAT